MAMPKTCQGCPYYDPAGRFIPDEMNPKAEVHIIKLSPGYNEVKLGQHDPGPLARGIRLAGLNEWSSGHLLRCKIPAKPRGNSAAWEAKVRRAAKVCNQYTTLPDVPIITVGKEVFEFYDDDPARAGIYSWRGFRCQVEVD